MMAGASWLSLLGRVLLAAESWCTHKTYPRGFSKGVSSYVLPSLRLRSKDKNACSCLSLVPNVPRTNHGIEIQVSLTHQGASSLVSPSIVEPELEAPQLLLDDDMLVQCLPVWKSEYPMWSYRKAPKTSSIGDFSNNPPWCRKPIAFITYHAYAELVTKSSLVDALPQFERNQLLRNQVQLPAASLAPSRRCMMCPDRDGSSNVFPWCLCGGWCHVNCSYQSHLGRICPSHVRILDQKRKIIIFPIHTWRTTLFFPQDILSVLPRENGDSASRSPVRTTGAFYTLVLCCMGQRLGWETCLLSAGFNWTRDSADTVQKASPGDHQAEALKPTSDHLKWRGGLTCFEKDTWASRRPILSIPRGNAAWRCIHPH